MTVETAVMLTVAVVFVAAGVVLAVLARRLWVDNLFLRGKCRDLRSLLKDAFAKVDRQKQSRQVQFEHDDKQKNEFRRIIATLRTTLQGIGAEDPTKPKVPTEQTFSPADTPTKGGE